MDASAQPHPWFVRDADKQLVVPLKPEEVKHLNSLPYSARGQFGDNLHRYIEQIGHDYGQKKEETT